MVHRSDFRLSRQQLARPAAKFFDNQDLVTSTARIGHGRGRMSLALPPDDRCQRAIDLDTSAWHNYTWDMSSTA